MRTAIHYLLLFSVQLQHSLTVTATTATAQPYSNSNSNNSYSTAVSTKAASPDQITLLQNLYRVLLTAEVNIANSSVNRLFISISLPVPLKSNVLSRGYHGKLCHPWSAFLLIALIVQTSLSEIYLSVYKVIIQNNYIVYLFTKSRL
ncbi:putative signal peptide protein [Halorubrum sp. AJ67]|nr:putative signal peptide protein [Halorubrum sp. AJ67]